MFIGFFVYSTVWFVYLPLLSVNWPQLLQAFSPLQLCLQLPFSGQLPSLFLIYCTCVLPNDQIFPNMKRYIFCTAYLIHVNISLLFIRIHIKACINHHNEQCFMKNNLLFNLRIIFFTFLFLSHFYFWLLRVVVSEFHFLLSAIPKI